MHKTLSDHSTLSLSSDGSFNVSFSAVMDQTFEEVIINDAAGRILFINRSFESSTGLSREMTLGSTIDVLKDGVGETAYYTALCQVMKQKEAWQGKLECRSRDGRFRTYYVTITPVREEGGPGLAFLSVRRDVTELSNQEKQLQQAGKMEAIGTLAGGIAHDFNNILAGIVGYAELVKEDLEVIDHVHPNTHTRLDNMISGAMRAKKLIQQILTFSRSGQESRYPVTAGPLVKEVVQLLRASLPSTIEIVLTLDSTAKILAEPTQIHQILMNLCTNAKDAMMETGGTLSISLSDVRARGGLVEGKRAVRLCVADTGPGIDKENRTKVLEPFFTTKPLEKGTGMGLSVVHGIVRGLEGSLEITKNSPHGAVFTIYLPVYSQTGAVDDNRNTSPEPARGNNECILFVDDEPDLITIARDGFSSMGYRVVGFDDSRKALGWFRENPQTADLLVADVTMPGLPGDLLMQEIQTLRPDLPALLITGASERLNETEVKELGALALLYKPMVMTEMANVFRQALDRGNHG